MTRIAVVFDIPEDQMGPNVQNNLEMLVLATMTHCAVPEAWSEFQRWMTSCQDLVTANAFSTMEPGLLILLAGRLVINGQAVMDRSEIWPGKEIHRYGTG